MAGSHSVENGARGVSSCELVGSNGETKLIFTTSDDLAALAVTGVSRWRWYCLIICSLVAAMQGGYRINFGPISESVMPFFGWQYCDIALLANWGPITFILFSVPFTWLMDVKGTKPSCIVAALLLFAGSLFRIAHVSGNATGIFFMHVGQILNNIPALVAMGIGPVMAVAWFPPNERTTATAIVGVANYGGTAAIFALGPSLVKPGMYVGEQLWFYMFCQCVAAGALLIGVLWMPVKPQLPPSNSLLVTRTMMSAGFSELSRKSAFWPIAISYSLVAGCLGCWGSQLGPIIQDVLPPSVAQDDAGWMGFWGAVAGMVVGVSFGLAADRCRMGGRKKPLVLVACTLSFLLFVVFAGLCSGFLGDSNSDGFRWQLFATAVLAALFCNACIPLFFEMAVEATYPIAEGLTTNVLTVICNVAQLIFLGMQSMPGTIGRHGHPMDELGLRWRMRNCTYPNDRHD